MTDLMEKMAANPALANTIFGSKAGGKIFTALGDPQFFQKILGELLHESQGYAAKVSEARMSGFDGAASMLQGAMLNLEGAIGRAFDNDGKGGFLTDVTKGAASLTQALAEADPAKVADCSRMSPKTFNKHLSRLNEFWKWAAAKGAALQSGTPSIFAGSFIKVQKNRIGRRLRLELRRKFEEHEIVALLTSPTFLGARSARDWKTKGALVVADHRYWITLIGLLHGMRREEPIVLKVRHVKQKAGIWYFDLLDDEIVPLLKDVGSPRHVPLHKDLLELGFIDARVTGRRPDSALFPEAVSHSEIARHGDPFGKWFLNFRRFHGVDDAKLDFHSVRHTVISRLLDAGVPENHIEEICGHEGAGHRHILAEHGQTVGLPIELDVRTVGQHSGHVAAASLQSRRGKLVIGRTGEAVPRDHHFAFVNCGLSSGFWRCRRDDAEMRAGSASGQASGHCGFSSVGGPAV